MTDLSGIPQCGLACLISSLSATTCAATNTTCLCSDSVFESVVASCVIESCTIKEMLLIKNGTSSNCGAPEPDSDTSMLIITVVLATLQSIFFALRMLCRVVRIAQWGWDDTTIVVAFALTTSFIGAGVLETRFGIGRNVWTLTPDDINMFLKVFLGFEIIYVCALAIIKISICFLYLRIFPSHRFRVAVWATQVFNVALLVAFITAELLQCQPINYFWQGWDGEHEGFCINLEAFVYSHAGINIVLDFWMLALPASQIWHLNLCMKKKVGVFAMFGFGVLLTLVSIIRLVSLKDFASTTNPTMDFYYVGIWTAVEITAGLMVACMPAARLIVMHFISRVSAATRTHLSTPSDFCRARLGNSTTKGGSPTARASDRRTPDRSLHKVLSPRDLDKNRDYSMSVTVTSDKNCLSTRSDDLQLAEKGNAGSGYLELSEGAKSSPFSEQFRLSDWCSSPSESSRGILVTQNVSISTRSSQSPRHDLQDELASQGSV